MAPFRTVNDAVFAFRDENNVMRYGRRGDEIDIPEGDDLVRGDNAGSFTLNGEEPAPPLGTSMPEISPDWDASQFRSFVDDASIEEIVLGLNAVSDEGRLSAAEGLLKAEESRPKKVRKTLVDQLRAIVGDEEPGVGTINPVVAPPVVDEEILDDDADAEPLPVVVGEAATEPVTFDEPSTVVKGKQTRK